MQQLENDFLSLRAEARAAAAQVGELPNLQASLNDVRRKLDVLQQGGLAQILSTYRTRRQSNDTWKRYSGSYRERFGFSPMPPLLNSPLLNWT